MLPMVRDAKPSDPRQTAPRDVSSESSWQSPLWESSASASPKAGEDGREVNPREITRTKQTAPRPSVKLTEDRRRRAADQGRPAVDRPHQLSQHRRYPTSFRNSCATSSAIYRRTLVVTVASLLGAFPLMSTPPARSWASAASARAHFICLMVGVTAQDPLFLQFKEAQQLVFQLFLGRSVEPRAAASGWQGQRPTPGGERH